MLREEQTARCRAEAVLDWNIQHMQAQATRLLAICVEQAAAAMVDGGCFCYGQPRQPLQLVA